MNDLISRSALLRMMSHWKPYMDMVLVRNAVKHFPAVDAVPVVRCKDCKHWYEREPVCLKIYSEGCAHSAAWQERKPDDYCSYGERKDNGENESK